MSTWGKNGSARSCDVLLQRVEANDPKLKELVILPLKKFGSEEVFRLARSLGNNSYIRSLQASGHAIDDHTALEALGKALGPLESIAIGDSNMGDGGVCALCRGMESNVGITNGETALKSIDLSYKNVGKEGMISILRTLGHLQSLQFLDLSRNENIGPSFDFLDTASSRLALPLPIFPGLKHLDLSGCRLDGKSASTLLRAIQHKESVDESKHDRKLVLRFNANNLSDPLCVRDIMGVLAGESRMISELHLASCELGDKGFEEVVAVGCRSVGDTGDDAITERGGFLDTLDLSNNNITSIVPLVSRLHISVCESDCHYFSKLQTLILSGNSFGGKILSALEGNERWISSLRELDLSHTSCEIPGAVELLRHTNSCNSSLKKLNLFGNNLGSDGFVAMSKVMIGGHLSLEYLDLGGNGAAEMGIVALVNAIQGTYSGEEKNEGSELVGTTENALKVLVVGGNKGGSSLEAAVKECQRVHPGLDIARDKPKQNNSGMNGSGMLNNTPGLSWTS